MISKLLCFVFSYNLLSVLSLHPCDIINTCGECIRDSNACKWCSTNNYNGTRCKSTEEPFKDCSDVEDPKSFMETKENREFSSGTGKVTQIKPQQYHIKLRPGQSMGFDFSFKGADNYPADLYFLIDASNTMKAIKEAMIEASEHLYKEMKKLTNNVFLGLGTFIDKNALPFVQHVNSNVTYSFRNQLKLTDKLEDFKKIGSNIAIGTNYDIPEGGLDALAQVLSCKDEIGWRKESRKIVIFLTDSLSHSAGDGRWAGITKPYDGKCYVENDVYTKELEMDYPSFGVINKLAAKEGKIVIFAVLNEYLGPYKQMSASISGSKVIGFVKNDTHHTVKFNKNNLEKILLDIYKEITQTIKIKLSGMTPEDRKNLQISFDPNCISNKKDNYDAAKCTVVNGRERNFLGNLTLLRYYNKDEIAIDVEIEGIKESLNLKIDVIKECDCATNTSKIEHNSEACGNGGGDLKCGICHCNPNRYGDKCKCTMNEKNAQLSSNASCIAPGDADTCSGGRGSCVCGTCQCYPGFGGRFCECNENSCPIKCSDHGKCVCGKCECEHDWTGELCQCYKKDSSKCRSKDGRICNNLGKCECGDCECFPIATWDARRRLDTDKHCAVHCPDCQNKQCNLLTACATCHHRNNTECPVCHPGVTVNVTDTISAKDDGNTFTCEDVNVDIGCYTRFKYQYDVDEYKIKLFVQTSKNCIENYYVYGGIFLATLILIGIITIISWKLLQDYRDRQEYERFFKEHTKDVSSPCSNPIYAPASTTFRNPAFRKRSVNY